MSAHVPAQVLLWHIEDFANVWHANELVLDMSRGESTARSSLAALFPSTAMARLVIFFAVHPGARYHLRELSRLTCLSSASLQHELKRLAQLGALVRDDEGSRACYYADESHPVWYAWFTLLRASARPSEVLREALRDASDLDGAFVFGSFVHGDTRPDSDIDVFLIGTDHARSEAGRRLGEAELLITRPLHVLGYDLEELATRIRSGNRFVQSVLTGPQEWVRGGPEILPLPSTA